MYGVPQLYALSVQDFNELNSAFPLVPLIQSIPMHGRWFLSKLPTKTSCTVVHYLRHCANWFSLYLKTHIEGRNLRQESRGMDRRGRAEGVLVALVENLSFCIQVHVNDSENWCDFDIIYMITSILIQYYSVHDENAGVPANTWTLPVENCWIQDLHATSRRVFFWIWWERMVFYWTWPVTALDAAEAASTEETAAVESVADLTAAGVESHSTAVTSEQQSRSSSRPCLIKAKKKRKKAAVYFP